MHAPLTLPVLRPLALAVALAALAPAVGAQGVYKYTDPAGRIVYTDDPAAGGSAARLVETPAPPAAPVPAAALSASERKLLDQASQRAASLDRAVADIVAAHAELRAAEERRERGIEPIEGERQGHRFRPEYWQRQQALKDGVDIARAKLNDAIERRNEAR